ncbi:spore coat polysaccharide biosynthesis protein SpsF [Aestuariispira insulae]|uniref:Spore coat polysaccharide biosynthesis protein SpsF n=2 Tax=Aestuariispira insulae TaxID=1461337 RepID=A0A3D9H4A7_9PROT|nr:spore coat polysaccharide biosynthesis protein SpsF [Aestuariispira insulae]
MGATRLPGKVMRPLAGKPLIAHIVERLRFSRRITDIVLATTVSPADDVLQAWCEQNGILCVRGSEADVLGRYCKAANAVGADVIARITADDPFKDPVITDLVVDCLLENGLAFASNNNPPSYPEGLDAEVFTYAALECAGKEAKDPFEREHVTQFFYRNPDRFPQRNIACDQGYPQYRWTIDTEADFQMAEAVYSSLYREGQIFLMNDIIGFLEENPLIAKMNIGEKRSAMYEGLSDES